MGIGPPLILVAVALWLWVAITTVRDTKASPRVRYATLAVLLVASAALVVAWLRF